MINTIVVATNTSALILSSDGTNCITKPIVAWGIINGDNGEQFIMGFVPDENNQRIIPISETRFIHYVWDNTPWDRKLIEEAKEKFIKEL